MLPHKDVHCLLGEVAEEQRKLGENKSHLQDQITLQDNEQNVQVFISIFGRPRGDQQVSISI